MEVVSLILLVVLKNLLCCTAQSINFEELPSLSGSPQNAVNHQNSEHIEKNRIIVLRDGGDSKEVSVESNCTTLHHTHWNQRGYVPVPPLCLVLYSDENCTGENRTMPEGSNIQFIYDFKLKSFRHCDPDILRYFLRPYSLSAKIVKFELNEAYPSIGETFLQNLQNQTVFFNDYIHSIIRNTTDTVQLHTDQLTIYRSDFIAHLSEWHVSPNAVLHNTIVLEEILQKIDSQAISELTKFPNGSTSIQNHAWSEKDIISYILPQYDMKSTNKSNGEESDVKNNANLAVLEHTIKWLQSSIPLAYRNQNKSKTKYTEQKLVRFVGKKVFRLPDCSEYEVASFIKRSTIIVIKYCPLFEVTGRFGNWQKQNITAPRLLQLLLLKSVHARTFSDYSVLVETSCNILTVDVSWYSIITGKSKVLPARCKKVEHNEYKLDNGTNQGVYIAIGSVVALVVTTVIGVVGGWFYYKKNYIAKGKLTRKMIKDFMNGLNDSGVAEIGENEGALGDLGALKFPYDKSLEIRRDTLDIQQNILLGAGEFGCVYKAIITKVDERVEVALKMAKENCPSTGLLGILSEIKILTYLGTHQNIAGIQGAYTKELLQGRVFVATELCHLGSLQSYLRRGKFDNQNPTQSENDIDTNSNNETDKVAISFGDMLQWSYEIACGMEYLCEKNVIHADLATRNVLLTSEKTAKITDFGLSKRLYEYTNYVKSKQEPMPWRWMAVESLQRMDFSAKSDVWSYGVTLWEIFTLGHLPYPGLSWSLQFVDDLVTGLRLGKPPFAESNM